MRDPVARPVAPDTAATVSRAVEQSEQPSLPAPAQSLMPRTGLKEPDTRFLDDIAKCIRSGVRPLLAAQWLGVSRKTFKAWRSRHGPLYDELRSTIASARAHLEVKLMSELAKRSPGQALKGLRRQTDDEPEPSRRYDRSGVNSLRRLLPALLDRVNDDAVLTETLTDVEQIMRTFRNDLIADTGGRSTITSAKLALVNAAVGSWLVLSCVDRYLVELAEVGQLVSRKHRRLFPIAEQRMRIADSLTRQLQTLGLDKQPAPPQSLDSYVRDRYGSTSENTTEPEKETV
jgi:hypothetical protein